MGVRCGGGVGAACRRHVGVRCGGGRAAGRHMMGGWRLWRAASGAGMPAGGDAGREGSDGAMKRFWRQSPAGAGLPPPPLDKQKEGEGMRRELQGHRSTQQTEKEATVSEQDGGRSDGVKKQAREQRAEWTRRWMKGRMGEAGRERKVWIKDAGRCRQVEEGTDGRGRRVGGQTSGRRPGDSEQWAQG
eukprot:358902-Chlamydomonas_euryale.AAC.3